MTKNYLQAWHYNISIVDGAFELMLNGQVIGNIRKSPAGKWPVNVVVNERLYSFTRKKGMRTFIEVANVAKEEVIGIIKVPFFSALSPFVKMDLTNGEQVAWEVDNFFSLHWKWKNKDVKLVEAIENLAGQYNSGVVGITEYNEMSDLLIMAGFFLSLLRRSKLSMGMKGLKRKTVRFKSGH